MREYSHHFPASSSVEKFEIAWLHLGAYSQGASRMSSEFRQRFARMTFDTWVLGEHATNQGVQVYARKLLEHFSQLASEYRLQISVHVPSANSHKNVLGGMGGIGFRTSRVFSHGRLWRYGGAAVLVSLDRCNLIFNPHCATFYAAAAVPAVTTIHDVIPVLMPEGVKEARLARFLLWSAARFSRRIITVSEHSKKDLMRLYGLNDSQVSVIYNGCDHDVFNPTPPDADLLRKVKQRQRLEGAYLLHYGAIKPNKNLKRLIMAYECVLNRNPELEMDLVLAGTADLAYAEISRLSQCVACPRGRVILTGPLEQSELLVLLKGCSLAAFPSLYEGFCLPMIESMACGVPVIAANSSCLPEISGGALRYFDPECVEEMAACIETVLHSEDLCKELSERGQARARQFDWKGCARQTLSVLAELAHADRFAGKHDSVGAA